MLFSKCCKYLNASDIYCLIKPLIAPFLGKYIYANGQTSPAFCIGKAESNIKTTGVEAVLCFVPETVSTELTTTGSIEKQKWRVTLIDRSDGLELQEIVKALKSISSQYRVVSFPTSKTYDYPVIIFEFFLYQLIQ